MSVTDEIKSRIDIVDLVSQTVKLRRSGKNYTGFCPFHDNKRTPAFVVFSDSGTWRCFGQCNEGGDIFKFVMKKEGWDFAETLKFLAERAGVELHPQTEEQKEKDEQYNRLHQLLDEVVIFYRHQLLQTPQGENALNYLTKRGVKRETIETVGLGYSPASWDMTYQYFLGKGYTIDDLVQAGMVTERDNGGYYDRFRNRLMFAIRDVSGRMAGFGARALNPEDNPKYLNSPQTSLFDKGRLLYGLDLARKAIRMEDQAVIVEGYMDVIIPYQAGFANTVSPMGTALTEEHLRMLKRYTRTMILALDADAAGEKATLRGLNVARNALDRDSEIQFDPRGLIRNEGRLQADVRVTTIPAGMDPDEVVLRDPEEWRQILQAAKPVVMHVMETLASQKDLDDPKVKRDIANQVLPLIEDVPNPVERDAYRQRLARLLKVDERALVGEMSAARGPISRKKIRIAQEKAPVRRFEPVSSRHLINELEHHIIRLLVREPEWLHIVDRSLQKAGLNHIDITDFENSKYQILIRLIIQSLEQDLMEVDPYLNANVPEDLAEELHILRNDPLASEIKLEQKLKEDLVRSVFMLRMVHVKENLDQIRYLMDELEEQGDSEIDPYQEMRLSYTLLRGRLDQALGSPIQLD
ncbi:MAG: DNA primase [Chloroflexi bacterium 44-23]|nr:MAG: DNA primase [Chloroflexi bacterium 44-23]